MLHEGGPLLADSLHDFRVSERNLEQAAARQPATRCAQIRGDHGIILHPPLGVRRLLRGGKIATG
jgi:hypothetical protein